MGAAVSSVSTTSYIDLAGPFQGATFLVVVDAYSKWPFVSTTVEKTIDELRQ